MPSKPFEGCTFNERPVRYTRIEVKASGRIVVVGPNRESMDAHLARRGEWVKGKKKLLRELEREASLERGKTLYLGRWHPKGEFLSKCKNELRGEFREPLRIHADAFLDAFGNAPKVRIRKMHSKYGVFSRKKNEITLSVYLAFLPKRLIEYVCFHEYLHKFEKSHSAKFWETVKRQYPDYLEIERQLKIWWIRKGKLCNKYATLESI